MKKLQTLLVACAASLMFLQALPLAAAPNPVAAEQQESRQRAVPFRGKISAVDKQNKTITVGERVFQITGETRIVKAGKPATLDDATVGEEIGGAYLQGADKTMQAVSVRLGAKPQAPKKESKSQRD